MKKLLNKVWISDGSYLLQRSLHVPELWELKSKKTGLRTGGAFGFLKSLNHEFKNLDYYPVVCWDAGLAPWRTSVYPMYKRFHIREAERTIRNKFNLSPNINKALATTLYMNETIATIVEDLRDKDIEISKNGKKKKKKNKNKKNKKNYSGHRVNY